MSLQNITVVCSSSCKTDVSHLCRPFVPGSAPQFPVKSLKQSDCSNRALHRPALLPGIQSLLSLG